jgi:hypothetical protein
MTANLSAWIVIAVFAVWAISVAVLATRRKRRRSR